MSPVKKKKKGGIKVDFSDVETRVLLPEGDYHVKVEEVTEEESGEGNAYLKWTFRTMDDDKAIDNKPLWYNTSLLPQALWNLRGLLEALGVEIEDDMELDLDEYADLECMVSVEHEKYEGKTKAKIVDYAAWEEETPGDRVAKAAKGKKEKNAEGDEDTEVEEGDEGEEEEGEEGEEEEGEEGEEEAESYTTSDVKDMEEDELADLVKKHSLKVKMSLPLKKRRAAILAALEENDLLSDE